ncbi:MAG: hypothetical protein WBC44_01550 [Planctomycetaceae bacterium]
MKPILIAAGVYAGFVLHVALHYSEIGAWAPNLTLIAGLAATRCRGGIAWAAAAGLLCDCLAGRPLGTTMLATTLVVTVARHFGSRERLSGWRMIGAAFLGIALIELAARLLVGVTAADSDFGVTLTDSLRVATTSAATVAFLPFSAAIVAALLPSRSRSTGLASLGGVRAADRMSGRV